MRQLIIWATNEEMEAARAFAAELFRSKVAAFRNPTWYKPEDFEPAVMVIVHPRWESIVQAYRERGSNVVLFPVQQSKESEENSNGIRGEQKEEPLEKDIPAENKGQETLPKAALNKSRGKG